MFKPPLVQKLDEGKKWQTRRLLPIPPTGEKYCDKLIDTDEGVFLGLIEISDLTGKELLRRGKRVRYNGIVYLKEAYLFRTYPVLHEIENWLMVEAKERAIFPEDLGINSYLVKDKAEHKRYESDYGGPFPKFKNKMFMPCSAARKFYDMVPMKVHRISEITEEDAEAEGTELGDSSSYVEAFQKLWDSIHKPGHRWSDDPWVIAYSIRPNEIMNSIHPQISSK